MKYFYNEIEEMKKNKTSNEQRQTLLVSSIKVNLLLMINLTHNNGFNFEFEFGKKFLLKGLFILNRNCVKAHSQ